MFLDKFFIDTRGIENAIIKSVLQHDNLVYVTIANSIVRISTEVFSFYLYFIFPFAYVLFLTFLLFHNHCYVFMLFSSSYLFVF